MVVRLSKQRFFQLGNACSAFVLGAVKCHIFTFGQLLHYLVETSATTNNRTSFSHPHHNAHRWHLCIAVIDKIQRTAAPVLCFVAYRDNSHWLLSGTTSTSIVMSHPVEGFTNATKWLCVRVSKRQRSDVFDSSVLQLHVMQYNCVNSVGWYRYNLYPSSCFCVIMNWTLMWGGTLKPLVKEVQWANKDDG